SLRRDPHATACSLARALLVRDDDAARSALRRELARARLRRWQDVVVFDVAPELSGERRPHRGIGKQRESRYLNTCAPAARTRTTRPRPGTPAAAAASSIAETTREASRAGATASTLGPAPESAAPNAPASRAAAMISPSAGTSLVRAA